MYSICHSGRSSSGGFILVMDILFLTIERFLKYLPILVIAIFVAQFFRLYLTEDKIGIFLKRKARRNILIGSLLGLVTPGPLASFLPLLRVLKSGGLQLSVVAAFITSQTLVGPIRAFLEVDLFGTAFFVYRVVISFLIAMGVGLCFQLLRERLNRDQSINARASQIETK